MRGLCNAAASCRPDFHICIGDDFSVDTLRAYMVETVAGCYTLQRPFLGLVAQSAPLFLLLTAIMNRPRCSISIRRMYRMMWRLGANARNRYFPMPGPDVFYSGDAEPLQGIGPLKDYYAWTWGDALFVVAGQLLAFARAGGQSSGRWRCGRGKDRDWWDITLGDAQYQWLRKTLAESKAKFEFVFARHVLGSGPEGWMSAISL